METTKRSMPPAAIAAGIGGVLLALGSVLTWVTVSVNVDAIARAVGIDPSQIPPGAIGDTTQSFSGTSGTDGKVTLVCGIVVILGAIGIALAMGSRRVLAALAGLAGLVGGLFALYDATIAKNNAIDDATRTLSGAGLPGSFRDFFSVSLGIGIWMCVIGGIVAVVGAVMALASGEAAPTAPSYAMAGTGTGFGPTTSPPSAGSSTWEAPAAEPPASPPPSESAPPATPPAGTEPPPPAPPEPPA
jgi:hypothetical protein